MTGLGPPYQPPEPLSAGHDRAAFDCGQPALDDWLRRRALSNQESGASRTYVMVSDRRVVGYHALAVGAVASAEASGRVRRNMPDPIPVMVLARLAVDRSHQERGLGRALLRDAVLRTLQAANIAGIRALLVHAKTGSARRFYVGHGFRASPVDPMVLMVTLHDMRAALGAAPRS